MRRVMVVENRCAALVSQRPQEIQDRAHFVLVVLVDVPLHSHERVEDDRGRVALQRGPIVFAAEWPDPREVRPVRWPLFVRAGRVEGRSVL